MKPLFSRLARSSGNVQWLCMQRLPIVSDCVDVDDLRTYLLFSVAAHIITNACSGDGPLGLLCRLGMRNRVRFKSFIPVIC